MVKWPYLLVWSSLITHITSHKVTESSESEEQDLTQNTTTLYPVVNATVTTKNENKEPKDGAKGSDTTTWKLETAYAESKLPESFRDNGTESKETRELDGVKSENCSKEFRPSPQLGTFIGDSSETVTNQATLSSFRPMKKPVSGFLSSHRDPFRSSLHNTPREIFKQNDFPYKIEDTIFTKAKSNWQAPTLDSKPTVEVPVKVPAGNLYKSPEAFKDKPGVSGDEEDFGLDFNGDVKEHSLDIHKEHSLDIKKRVNPWKNLLRLITAFIPVGIIISALTPSVITIENTNSPDNRYPQPFYRRTDSAELEAISEPCRRRLLCELRSETNYMHGTGSPQRKGKRCYKLRCEDPEALSKALHWLLTYHRGGVGSGDDDQRGRNYT